MSITRPMRPPRFLAPALRRDDGMALATVMAMSVILFLLATTLVMVATQQQIMTSAFIARNKALQVADAGVTAYLYQLRYDSTYYVAHPTMGPTATTEGSWTVTASRASASGPITLRSVGEIPSLGSKRTIVATVRFPSFSDYMIVMNESYDLSPGFKVIGKVYSNGDVTNDGEITGHVYAKGDVSGSGTFDAGYTERCVKPTIDFSGVSADMALLKAAAQNTGTYFPPASGGIGYRVVLSGNGGYYQKVTAVNGTTGNLTLSGTQTAFTIPAPPLDGVLFFDDEVWIDGTYSRPVTVVSSSNQVDNSNSGSGGIKGPSPNTNSAFYIVGRLMPSDTNSTAVCGLVAPGDTSIPIWYDTIQNLYHNTGTEFDVYAAMISQNGTLHVDNDNFHSIAKLYVRGSRTGQQAGNFSGLPGGGLVFEYDFRFDQQSPPLFPIIRDGSMTVDSWIEN
jgi:hypothetical protein